MSFLIDLVNKHCGYSYYINTIGSIYMTLFRYP